ncbi:MAG: hypothetical protein GX298_01205 [Planctomycetes bacterium]|nr:hypothetical protein [Planctomycetota bacterium]
MFDKKKFKSYIPQHPFKHGKRGSYDAFYMQKSLSGLESALNEYGAIRDPLTDAERQILVEAFGTLKSGIIRRHLANDFTPAQIENLTWDDIVYHAQGKIDTTDQAPPKQDINVLNSKSTPEEIAAYQLTHIGGYTQQKAAELMSEEKKFKLKYPKGIKQSQISRWVSRYVKRLEAHGLPVEIAGRSGRVHADIDTLNVGQRTDGRNPKKSGF